MQISYYHIAEAFGLSELILLLVKRSKKSGTKNQADSRSLIILWITITACIGIGIAIAMERIWTAPNTSVMMYTGLALALAGFVIRWTAIAQLGKMFTVDVAIVNSATLKTTGLYKIVRHPSYLGLMLIICSIAFCLCDILACIMIILPCFIALNYRISVEEKALVAEFGDQYEKYKRTTARLIPGIY